MKLNKKVVESVVVAIFAFAIIVTAAVTGDGNSQTEQYAMEDKQEEIQVAEKEKATVEVVAAEAVEEQEEVVIEEVVSEWDTKLMSNVDGALNIRGEADAESELVGKLYENAVADIVERGEEWTKISSGNVEGYVKNEFCVFGAEAEAKADEKSVVYATALVGGLRVREEADASDGVGILCVLGETEKIEVDKETQAPEGWVAVLCDDETGFVSAEYVTVEVELGTAISIEEEMAAIKKAQEEEAARKAAQQASAGTVQRGAVAATYDDVTLLGALIQCEAGGECYEGQLAVGAVVMNRLRCGFSNSIYGVIYQSGQFGPASSGKLANRLANGVSASCLQAAQDAINGADNVSGALYFKRADTGHPGIVIGNHVFY